MSLSVTVSTTRPASVQVEVLVVPLYSQGTFSSSLPEALRRHMGVFARRLKFEGDWGKAIFFPVTRGSHASFVALVGLGEQTASAEHRAEGMRRSAAVVAQEARRHALRSLALTLVSEDSVAPLAAAFVEGISLTEYRFTEYSPRLQEEQAMRSIKKIIVLVAKAELKAARDAIRASHDIMAGVMQARDLVNQPASALSPASLVEAARKISANSKNIRVRVLNREQAAEQKFNGFLAVARGSKEEPYVIHLTYFPPGKPASTDKVYLIGKGITFDSGGLSIKPADFMESMKIDMAGAAAVLGLFSVLDHLRPDVEVHGVIAACENMPSGSAYRPGDILTAKNGKTIEVLNTDAEGRITLADALVFASEQKPAVVIDLATLTGACVVALGETVAGLWSNNEALQQSLLASAGRTGEQMCALPLPAEYRPFIQSRVADVRNTATTRYGGAITAALFLQEFVGENVAWAHLDIAGPAYLERHCLAYYLPGATGYGVRVLADYLKNYHSTLT